MNEGKEARVALVTGANKGLGFETAKQLAERGFLVLVAARREDTAREAAAKLAGQGLRVEPLVLDVTAPADIERAQQHIEKAHGKLDVLVNNAAVRLDPRSMDNSTLEVGAERLRATFETNFFGLIALTHALLPLIRRSPAGRIVNMSSVMGSLAMHADPSSPIYGAKPFAYDASKAALNAYTIHLAHALAGTPVKVNSAHPGWVKTDLGGAEAPLDVKTGAETGVALALLNDDGPTGGFFHQGDRLPW